MPLRGRETFIIREKQRQTLLGPDYSLQTDEQILIAGLLLCVKLIALHFHYNAYAKIIPLEGLRKLVA
jgi:hypothetical protein